MAFSNSVDDKQLLKQVATGSDAAFKQLYQQYSDAIYGVAFTYTKSQVVSEEVVQDVFLKIWIGRSSLVNIDNFSNYIFIIARNHIINHLERNVKERAYYLHLSGYFQDKSNNPEEALVFKESKELIEKAISNLPPQQKAVYQLVKVQGMKLNDAAAELGLTRNTVRNHLDRAIKSMQSFIRQQAQGLLLFVASLIIDN